MNKNNFLWLLIFVLIIPFSFGATLNGSSSIYTFNVTNCVTDDYFVGCAEQTIRFSCDISNKQFIDSVDFVIDNTTYSASVTGFNFYVDFLKLNQTFTVNESIDLSRIYITDTNFDTVVFDENVSVLHDCVTCTDVGVADACSVADSSVFRHVFEPVGCAVDFNESISCDYCEEDVFQVLGDCLSSNNQTVNYYDNNFFTCCDITGLDSDCDILDYPYNETTVQSCEYLTTDFSCDFPSLAELRDEMSFSCLLPDNDDYKCIVQVYEDERIVQTNPEFKDYSQGVISISGKRVESKEFFTPSNRLLNAYFTDKNLITESEFMVEVVCSSDSNVYVSQHLVSPFYESVGKVLNRVSWARENAEYLVVAFLVLVVLLALGFYIVRVARGRR